MQLTKYSQLKHGMKVKVKSAFLYSNGENMLKIDKKGNVYLVSGGSSRLIASKNENAVTRPLWDSLMELESVEDKIVELTLPEIAAKFNIPVDQLRIKE